AGILMFEQNNDNVIAENSATHGGDCFFGFAGREALGEDWLDRERERLRKETGKQEVDDQLQYPPELLEKYRRRGNNNNLLINNDFSYAPAHGIEMTFSFGNKFIGNRLVGNAICGVWGGYSQQTLIDGNDFEGNGEGAYGLERGGVNIEHGRQNAIINNHFKNNKCGVHLWWDPDEGLLRTPWGKANDPLSADNRVVGNTFEGDELVLQLRECRNTLYAGNQVSGVRKELECSPGSEPVMSESVTEAEVKLERPQPQVLGQTRPVGARKQLAGRQNIIITEWGPYDFSRVTVVPPRVVGGAQATLQVLGPSGRFKVESVNGDVKVTPMEGDLPGKLTIQSEKPGVHPFSLQIDAGGTRLAATGSLMRAEWTVKYFVWHPSSDPREDQKAWDELLNGEPRDVQHVGAVDFVWGGGAPTPKVPSDHFGTLATTTLSLPAGKWRIHTVSDDGIRVWIDDQKLIDDWTWHPPKENDATVELKDGEHRIRIEHFEIDGFAQLQFRIEPEP
ncbi:MAG TPA: PA14 domain-containing protein, partial [Phycisphaerae bacterium]